MPAPILTRAPYQINTLISGNDQFDVRLTALVNGRFALGWESNNGNVADFDIRLGYRKANGDFVSLVIDDEPLAASAVIDEESVAVAALTDGRIAYVWHEVPGSSELDTYAQVRNADGTILRGRFAVSDVTAVNTDDQYNPSVIGLADGKFMVAYNDISGATDQIEIEVFDVVGAQSASQVLSTSDAEDNARPRMTRLSDGNVVVFWYSDTSGTLQQKFAIVSPAGAIVTAETDANPEDAIIEVLNGSVAALPDGNFMMLFDRTEANNIQGRLYAPDGTALSQRFDISVGPGGATAATVTADGRVFAVYQAGGDIFGQMLFADGTKDGGLFTISSTIGFETSPEAITLADGRVVVSWHSDENGNDDIFAAIYDPREIGLNASASGLDDDWIGTGLADRVYLGPGNDAISAAIGNDTIYGEAGNDTINGDEDNDKLYGGNDNDTLFGGGEDDTLNGELGDDTLNGDAGSDTMNGGGGNDTVFGGTEGDILNGNDGADSLEGQSGQDVANGGNGDDFIYGDADKDTLNGDDGNDEIDGGDTGDTLRGGNGDDLLEGGLGGDVLVGGAGFDTYYFRDTDEGNDRIDDWVAADDQLRFFASNFGVPLGPLDPTRLVVAAAPAANQAFMQFLYNTTSGQLSWDADGTGAATAISITRLLNGGVAVATLTTADFDFDFI